MLLYNYAFIYYITYYYEYICYKEINISMNYFLFKYQRNLFHQNIQRKFPLYGMLRQKDVD